MYGESRLLAEISYVSILARQMYRQWQHMPFWSGACELVERNGIAVESGTQRISRACRVTRYVCNAQNFQPTRRSSHLLKVHMKTFQETYTCISPYDSNVTLSEDPAQWLFVAVLSASPITVEPGRGRTGILRLNERRVVHGISSSCRTTYDFALIQST